MFISIKGREADQHRINVESVIKLFSNFNRFLKEVGKKHDIMNLEIQIVEIHKTSFSFEIEPTFPAPLLAEERKNDFLEDTEKILYDFENEDEEELEKYSKEMISSCAASFTDFNELFKKDYRIAIRILKKDISIQQKNEDYLDKYREKYNIKERKILDGVVSGTFIIKNNRISGVENYEYLMEASENTIIFNFVRIENRVFRFKKPITTKIFLNNENSIEIPFPDINQSAFGMNDEDAIQSFRELVELLYDEYYLEEDKKLHQSGLQIKEYLKKLFFEESRDHQ
jgi:hypothetical protein